MQRDDWPPAYSLFEECARKFSKRRAIRHLPNPSDSHSVPEDVRTEDCWKWKDEKNINFSNLHSLVERVAGQLSSRLAVDRQRASSNNAVELSQVDSLVIIYLPPGIERICLQLACIKLKLPQLNIDRQYSIGRIEDLLHQTKPICIVTCKEYLADGLEQVLTDKRCSLEPVSVLLLDELFGEGRDVKTDSVDVKSMSLIQQQVKDPVLFIISTSGSSHQGPKIIALHNSQFVNRLSWQYREIDQSSTSVSGECHLIATACMFIDYISSLFAPLLSGHPVVVIGSIDQPLERHIIDFALIAELIEKARITRLTIVPSLLSHWLNQVMVDSDTNFIRLAGTLNTLIVSGELLSVDVASDWFNYVAKSEQHLSRLINLYGSSEVMGDVIGREFYSKQDVVGSAKLINAKSGQTSSQQQECLKRMYLPVGKHPIHHSTLCIVQPIDHSDSTTPIEEKDPRNLAILGSQVTPTRIQQLLDDVDGEGEGTNKYRLTHLDELGELVVFGYPCKPGKSCFFTGDFGLIDSTSRELYVCGRHDDLIKVNGVRFCANEVDLIVDRVKQELSSQVKTSMTLAVQVDPTVASSHVLVCFYTLSDTEKGVKESNIDRELSQRVERHLPTFIRPVFLCIEELPLMSTSGKVDKPLLRKRYLQSMVEKDDSDSSSSKSSSSLSLSSTSSSSSSPSSPTKSLSKSPRKSKMDERSKRNELKATMSKILDIPEGKGLALNDNDDFFSIGGDSLKAALLVQELRHQGFNYSIVELMQRSRIGDILTDLGENKTQNEEKGEKSDEKAPVKFDLLSEMRRLIETTKWIDMNYRDGKLTIRLSEKLVLILRPTDSVEIGTLEQNTELRQSIIRLIVPRFLATDALTHFYQLTDQFLTQVVNEQLKLFQESGEGEGLVLLAFLQHSDSNPQLIGVHIALNSEVNKKQQFDDKGAMLDLLEFAQPEDCTFGGMPFEKILVDIMLAVDLVDQSILPPTYNNVQFSLDITMILHLLQIEMAMQKGFQLIRNVNIHQVTMEVCREIGYKILKRSYFKDYAELRNIPLDPSLQDVALEYSTIDMTKL